MQVTSFSGESPEELLKAIHQSPVSGPTLGIIFSSLSLDVRSLSTAFTTVPFPVIGCTSSGEIRAFGDENPILELSAVGCLLNPDPETFRVRLFERNTHHPFDLGSEIGRWGSATFQNPLFVLLVSGLTINIEGILNGIKATSHHPPHITGGLAGDDMEFKETFTFLNGEFSSDGVSVLLLDGDHFEVHTLITSGWQGVGAEKRITHSSENIIYTIDNRPAVDLYKEYLNLRDEDIPALSAAFPLIIRREPYPEIIRTPVGVDWDNRALIFSGSVPEGASAKFASSPGSITIQNSIKDIIRFNEHIKSADLLLLFSCMARHQTVGNLVQDEIIAAQKGNTVPLIGFFCYGEIGTDDSGWCDFHNETFTLMAIRERHP